MNFLFLPLIFFYCSSAFFIKCELILGLYDFTTGGKLIEQCVLDISLENLIFIKIIPFYDDVHENMVLFVVTVFKMCLRGNLPNL